jgi:hypothetical protein
VLLVEVGDHLGVAVAREAMTGRSQLGTELAVVVDLAVLDDVYPAVLVWSPVSRSMIESLRAAMPTPPSKKLPALSGPRWASFAFIAASSPGSALRLAEAIPQIPHTGTESSSVRS